MGGLPTALGNAWFMQSLDAQAQTECDADNRLRAEGKTVMFLAIDGKLAGLVAFADPIK